MILGFYLLVRSINPRRFGEAGLHSTEISFVEDSAYLFILELSRSESCYTEFCNQGKDRHSEITDYLYARNS